MDKDSLVREFIGYIRQRPRIYLRVESLRQLGVYLCGFSTGLDFAGNDTPPGDELGRFFAWVRNRYKAGSASQWDDLIIEACNGDDRAAFDTFFVLWDEY